MSEQYFKLFFDAQGYPQDSTNQAAVIDALVNSATPVTDLWILAYGWNNDLVSGTQTYDTWVARMQEVHKEKFQNPAYNPRFLGIYWPSKALIGTIMKQAASSTTTTSDDTTGGGAGEFEMGGDSLTQPAPGPGAVAYTEDRDRFISEYRPVMDPEGIYGDDYDRDFSRLYTLMSQAQPPTDQQIRDFVKILKKYETPDPHSDPIERQNIGSVPVEVVVNQLKESQRYESFSAHDALQKLFGAFSFWKMKGRAAIVGENGVYRFLVAVKQAFHQYGQRVRIHLLGHSFGAKLVTAAVYPAAQARDAERPFVNTLVLLLGAFSQFSFSKNIPVVAGAAGHYAAILDRGVVANPVLAIYSRYDSANKFFYPLGMRFALPSQRFEMGNLDDTAETYTPSKDPFGALGANGIQGLDEKYRAINMLSRKEPYIWSDLTGISCLNVDGQQFINQGSLPAGAHNDTGHYEIFYLALAMSLR
jgi:hypothetical protein